MLATKASARARCYNQQWSGLDIGSYRKDPVDLVVKSLLTRGDRIVKTIERLSVEPDAGFVICHLLHGPVVLDECALSHRRVDAIYVAVIALPSNNQSAWIVPSAVDADDDAFHRVVGHGYDLELTSSGALHCVNGPVDCCFAPSSPSICALRPQEGNFFYQGDKAQEDGMIRSEKGTNCSLTWDAGLSLQGYISSTLECVVLYLAAVGLGYREGVYTHDRCSPTSVH